MPITLLSRIVPLASAVSAVSVVLGLAGVAVLTGGGTPAPAAAAARPVLSGVYDGAANPAGVASFAAARGRPATVAVDFLAGGSWNDIAAPDWWLQRWEARTPQYHMVYSVPLLPTGTGTLAQGAAGAYDRYFFQLGRRLVADAQGDATIRLGWEFNGTWFPWSVSSTRPGFSPASFAAYWRHVVRAMRRVPGAAFTFDWTVNPGASAVPAEQVWPGNGYVDYVGVDVYDMGWAANGGPVALASDRWAQIDGESRGLDWWAAFARLHGKQVSIPEWGLMTRSDQHGGGDDPYFIAAMHSWIASHDVAYEAYFNSGSDTLSLYPQGQAEYVKDFGAGTTS